MEKMSIETETENGETPLFTINDNLVKYILEDNFKVKVNIKHKNNMKQNAILYRFLYTRMDKICEWIETSELLMKKGVNINDKDKNKKNVWDYISEFEKKNPDMKGKLKEFKKKYK